MNNSLVIEVHYLPNIEYFWLLAQHENIMLEKYEHFEKQTYRNRCIVKTSQGITTLSIPLSGRHGKILTKDIKIELGTKWRNIHWRTIESAYRKAPFFEFYSDDLKKIIFEGHELLFDLNFDLLSFCLRVLKLKRNISATMSYQKIPESGVNDYRNCVSSLKQYNLKYSFQNIRYQQIFGNTFASNLSVIDLLFCCGPESIQIISSSFSAVNKKIDRPA